MRILTSSVLISSCVLVSWSCSKNVGKNGFTDPNQVAVLGDKSNGNSSNSIEAKVDPSEYAKDMAKLSSDNDTINALLAKERSERIAADEEIRNQLALLESKLAALEQSLNTKLQVVDANAQKMADDFNKNLANLSEKIKKEYQAYVEQNYVSKTELQTTIQNTEKLLASLSENLNKEIQKTNANLSESIKKSTDELAARIGKVEVSVEAIQGALASAIADYKKSVSDLSAKITSVEASSTQKFDSFKKEFDQKLVDFEFNAQRCREELGKKIVELDSKMVAGDAALEAALKKAKEDFNTALALEQSKRQEINQKITAMTEELKKIAAIAESAEALSKQNAQEITKINSRVSELKVKVENVDTKLTDFMAQTSNKIDEVAKKSADMVQALGGDMQKQFADLTAKIGELNQNQASVEGIIGDIVLQLTKIESIFNILVTGGETSFFAQAKGSISNYIHVVGGLTKAFIDAYNPQQNAAAGSLYGQMNTSFQTMISKYTTSGINSCGANSAATFANAFGLDYFHFLALVYIEDALFGVSHPSLSLVDSNGAVVPLLGNQLGLSKLVAHGLTSYSVTTRQLLTEPGSTENQCMADIRSWARGLLYGSSDLSLLLRKQLLATPDFLVGQLKRSKVSLDQLVLNIDAIERVILEKTALNNPTLSAQLKKDVAQPTQDWLRLADYLVKSGQNAMLLEQRMIMFNKIADMAKQFGVLQTSIDALKADLDKFKVTVNTLQAGVGQLLQVLYSYFLEQNQSVYAEKIRKIAIDTNVVVPVDQSFTAEPQIWSMQHWYAGTGASCQYQIPSDPVLTNVVLPLNPCVINLRGVPVDGRVNRAGNLVFTIFGAASHFRENMDFTQVSTWWGGPMMDYSAKVSSASKILNRVFSVSYKTAPTQPLPALDQNWARLEIGSKNRGIFYLHDSKLLNNELLNGTWQLNPSIRFEACRLSDAANADSALVCGKSYNYWLSLYSPLILDFTSQGMLQTESEAVSSARFDLQGNGFVRSHGWIRGHEGAFLALDEQGTKLITSGRQLFGQATLINGRAADNGYQALSHYDSNHDGIIDARDPVFNKLVVWFDYNGNGKSELNEVKTLAEAGVTKIAVNYTAVADALKFNNGNMLPYQSKFWGPSQCGAIGCNTYDVYFGTSQTVASK